MMFADLLRGVLGKMEPVLTVTMHVSLEIGGSHFQVSFTVTNKVIALTLLPTLPSVSAFAKKR